MRRVSICHFGFHGQSGARYLLSYADHWLGCLTAEDTFTWTAGAVDKGLSAVHIPVPLKPVFITELPDGSLLVPSHGTNQVFRICPEQHTVEVFIDTAQVGLKDLGNCVYDGRGSLWVNEIEGCRVWQFTLNGAPILTLDNGQPGFQPGTARFDAVQFSWIYDLLFGPDGCPYMLDSKNFCVRRIDPEQRTVSVVVGTGKPGYTGGGGSAFAATLGSTPGDYFDGPYALCIDEADNLLIGDTQNHVVRMVECSSQRISTIAGKHEPEPGVRNNPLECDPRSGEPALDLQHGLSRRLFIYS